MTTFREKIQQVLDDLTTLNGALNQLGRYPEAARVQHAICEVSAVSTDGHFSVAQWVMPARLKLKET